MYGVCHHKKMFEACVHGFYTLCEEGRQKDGEWCEKRILKRAREERQKVRHKEVFFRTFEVSNSMHLSLGRWMVLPKESSVLLFPINPLHFS